MYRACFTASPTPALRALRQLADAGHLVGPVITNNFDALAARAGLAEHCVRRYDEIIPDVPLLPRHGRCSWSAATPTAGPCRPAPAPPARRSSTSTPRGSARKACSCPTRWKARRPATRCAARQPRRDCPPWPRCSQARRSRHPPRRRDGGELAGAPKPGAQQPCRPAHVQPHHRRLQARVRPGPGRQRGRVQPVAGGDQAP